MVETSVSTLYTYPRGAVRSPYFAQCEKERDGEHGDSECYAEQGGQSPAGVPPGPKVGEMQVAGGGEDEGVRSS